MHSKCGGKVKQVQTKCSKVLQSAWRAKMFSVLSPRGNELQTPSFGKMCNWWGPSNTKISAKKSKVSQTYVILYGPRRLVKLKFACFVNLAFALEWIGRLQILANNSGHESCRTPKYRAKSPRIAFAGLKNVNFRLNLPRKSHCAPLFSFRRV